jgi:hypothetical protein
MGTVASSNDNKHLHLHRPFPALAYSMTLEANNRGGEQGHPCSGAAPAARHDAGGGAAANPIRCREPHPPPHATEPRSAHAAASSRPPRCLPAPPRQGRLPAPRASRQRRGHVWWWQGCNRQRRKWRGRRRPRGRARRTLWAASAVTSMRRGRAARSASAATSIRRVPPPPAPTT